MLAIAHEFSPRYECHRDDLVSIDVSGLERLFRRRSVLDTREDSARGQNEWGWGPASGGNAPSASGVGVGPHAVWKAIGEELRREAASRGVRVHVAVAGTRMAAVILAHARPGVTIVEPGGEADALAPIPIGILAHVTDQRRSVLDTREGSACGPSERRWGPASGGNAPSASGAGVGPRASKERHGAPRKVKKVDEAIEPALNAFKSWGLKTLGELAALPSADLASRLGRQALVWQAVARGDDVRPLVPTLDEERFESSLELEWPIEGLEPLSFVLTRLLEPLSTRLERRDRGAAVLHVILRLVSKDTHTSRLELPTPMRDVRTLRTLALLDLESHPPAAAIDRVTIVIDPTPGRVLQHTLFTRAHPTPEQLSTLVARLGALMGQDRFGAPAPVDSFRPGAFAMVPFATEHRTVGADPRVRPGPTHGSAPTQPFSLSPDERQALTSALRRCRQPVPARVAVDAGRPVRVTTDRRGLVGGSVVMCAGPWRTSGEWWLGRSVLDTREGNRPSASARGGGASREVKEVGPRASEKSWNRDEWDVALNDGAVYRIFQDRETEAWFVDAIVD